ncbi:MAG: transposase [Elusimicrobiota bacterium]
MRDHELATGHIYHVFSRSIARYIIFNNDIEYSRILEVIEYYMSERPPASYSRILYYSTDVQDGYKELNKTKDKAVDIVAYCIMPTHIHLILKQLRNNGISIFMKNILNSYTRYFNTKHERKGPLWEGRFKSVLVGTDEYLMHLTRYVHLNPATAQIVTKPEEWLYSSYNAYIQNNNQANGFCKYSDLLKIDPKDYKSFVEDRISYQQELQRIKKLLLE